MLGYEKSSVFRLSTSNLIFGIITRSAFKILPYNIKWCFYNYLRMLRPSLGSFIDSFTYWKITKHYLPELQNRKTDAWFIAFFLVAQDPSLPKLLWICSWIRPLRQSIGHEPWNSSMNIHIHGFQRNGHSPMARKQCSARHPQCISPNMLCV